MCYQGRFDSFQRKTMASFMHGYVSSFHFTATKTNSNSISLLVLSLCQHCLSSFVLFVYANRHLQVQRGHASVIVKFIGFHFH
jgi:hypothetical protein